MKSYFGKVLKLFFFNLMPHGAEFKHMSLNEKQGPFNQSSLMEGKVHIWSQTWKMSQQMLPKSIKQINKPLIFKTLTHLLYCIEVSHRPHLSGITHVYKCFCKCSPTQEGKSHFHYKVTFTVRLSPFLNQKSVI